MTRVGKKIGATSCITATLAFAYAAAFSDRGAAPRAAAAACFAAIPLYTAAVVDPVAARIAAAWERTEKDGQAVTHDEAKALVTEWWRKHNARTALSAIGCALGMWTVVMSCCRDGRV